MAAARGAAAIVVVRLTRLPMRQRLEQESPRELHVRRVS